MTSHHATPLKFLAPGWFSVVMGLSGLTLACLRVVPYAGDSGQASATFIAVAPPSVIGLAMLMLWLTSLLVTLLLLGTLKGLLNGTLLLPEPGPVSAPAASTHGTRV